MSRMGALRTAGSLVFGRSGAVALFGGLGQALELRLAQQHHEVDMKYNMINLHQDMQNLRLDALDHAKEEIRSHYDTYVGRIDTLLLVLALIWPYALNTIQFSDCFLPGYEGHCPECIEEEWRVIVCAWALLVALILVLPFWGILCLIRVKQRLDEWLEHSLAGLKKERRNIVAEMNRSDPRDTVEEVLVKHANKADRAVLKLVQTVSEFQDRLGLMWKKECARLVHAAHSLLWMCSYAALWLSALSIWMFLWNKGGTYRLASVHFGCTVFIVGTLAPVVYHFMYLRAGEDQEDDADIDKSGLSLRRGSRSYSGSRVNLSRFPLAEGVQTPSDEYSSGPGRHLFQRQRSPMSSMVEARCFRDEEPPLAPMCRGGAAASSSLGAPGQLGRPLLEQAGRWQWPDAPPARGARPAARGAPAPLGAAGLLRALRGARRGACCRRNRDATRPQLGIDTDLEDD